MKLLTALRQVGRHPAFRRLAAVRVLDQAGDAALQLGMASYVLFSPQRQATPLAIALMFTVTLLPYTVLAPFVSVLLDRWSRRTVAIVVDVVRALVCATVAVLVLTQPPESPATVALFFALLLVAMSLNRFVLAGLSAALPLTVDDDELLAANTVMPVVAPVGALLAGLGAVARLGLTGWAGWPSTSADAVVFALAGAFFVGSFLTSAGFAPRALGPLAGQARTSAREVLGALGDGVAHLRARPAAGTSLVMLGLQRVGHGVAQVATILLLRNLINGGDEVRALADIGLWAGLTGVGFVLATLLTGPLFARHVRGGMAVAIAAIVVFQLFPGAWFARWPLLVSGLLLGVGAQTLKIGVDTVVQAHVDDDVKGRVFTIYDMVLNGANIVAAWLAVLFVPVDGASLPVFVAVSASHLVVGVWYWLRTRTLDLDAGTGSLA